MKKFYNVTVTYISSNTYHPTFNKEVIKAHKRFYKNNKISHYYTD